MNDKRPDIPTTEQFERELRRLRYKASFRKTLKSTVSSLIVVAAAAVIISTMIMPVLRVTGTSMTPTEVLICSKLSGVERGDIVAFYYNNKVLLKRVIGVAGDVINIDEEGRVFLNDEELDEPYISEKSLGECDIELPYQVPENRIFVMGDHRAVSVDSRSTSVGCVAEENIIGVVFIRVLPFNSFGFIE